MIKVFYDGECPFCTKYVALVQLREAAGPVELVNLREDTVARARFSAQGLDTDKGMIVETSGRVLHGADAIHALSMMSSGHGTLNAVAAAIFRHQVLAKTLYPILRAGRNMTLFALGREPMHPRDPGEKALFEIFARFLGIFAVLHALAYYFRYTHLDFKLNTVLLLVFGFGLILNPSSRRIFVLAIVAFAIDGWQQAPLHSNHTILKNFLTITIILAGIWHLLRGSGWDRFFRDFRPVGQTLLLIMYTFGIFHKINTDFLNPETSCAVALWREMPPPLVWIDNTAMHYLAIYGTFIAEGLIMLMLIVPRWRHLGICAGIGFHSLLALSGYAMYPAFSTLSIVLHTLFILPAAAIQITQSNAWQYFDHRLRSAVGVFLLLVAFALISLFALLRDYNMVAYVWLILMLWPLTIIALNGSVSVQTDQTRFFWSPLTALNAVAVLFFLNAAGPYLGLKTAQSLNMFANLRLEGGVSNHLVFSNAPGPFRYLEDLVTITAASGSPTLEVAAQRTNTAFVYYQFLSLLDREAPDAKVAFMRGGIEHPLTTVADILAVDGGMLHSDKVRKFFHFRPVNTVLPLPCE